MCPKIWNHKPKMGCLDVLHICAFAIELAISSFSVAAEIAGD